VPLTVAPAAGLVMNALSVPPPPTVTLRVAVAVRPAPSRTVSVKACGPLAAPAVFQLKLALVAAPDVVYACVPSMASVNVIGVPLAPVSDMPMATVPVTVAPAAGLVNEAPSGDPTPPPLLLTVTPRVVVAVRPAQPVSAAPAAT